MPRNDVHVVPYNGRWATMHEGTGTVGHLVNTLEEAVELARVQAQREGGQVLIHGRGGKPPDTDKH